ncbi:SurA N-terminal domain-containing protein [Desulfosarcina sp. OttesenSCG-928-G10]|nr:SurA N-terminal domain-containing protein [Desulfosarcina sp. OttesenSCG-928-G10]
MLTLMREHAGSWIIKMILIAIVIVFVFWGVGDFTSRKGNQVATVNDEIISLAAYQKAYAALVDQYRQQFGAGLDENLLGLLGVKEQALEQLIDRTLVLQEARKIGLVVADTEVVELIRSAPFFQTNGVFDTRRYQAYLAQERLTPEQFEEEQRNALLTHKLIRLVRDAAKVSAQEIKAWYNWENTMVDVDYVLFSRNTDVDPEVSTEALSAYYEAEKENYRTAPMRRIRYVVFDPSAYAADITIDDDAILEYYESHADTFSSPKKVEARHILITVDANTTDAEALKKAEEISERAKTGEDFAELAALYSDCPSKTRGGHLGFFGPGQMVKPFEDAAFSMTAGEISGPVRTEFGWHVIRVESIQDAASMSLDQARSQIVSALTRTEAQLLAHDHADQFYEDLYETDDLSKQAATAKLTVHETDAFPQREGPAELGGDKSAVAAVAFELNPGETSDVREINGRYYLIQTIDAIDAKVPPLDAVYETVTADLKKKMRSDQTKTMAEAMAADLRAGKSFAESAAAQGAVVARTGLFKRDAAVPGIGKESAFSRAAFEIQMNALTFLTPVEGSAGFYLLHLAERRLPPEDAIGKADQDRISAQLRQQKQNAVFEGWMAERRAGSRIVVEKKGI